MYISKRSGMDHTVFPAPLNLRPYGAIQMCILLLLLLLLPANTPCLPFLRTRSPDGATSN